LSGNSTRKIVGIIDVLSSMKIDKDTVSLIAGPLEEQQRGCLQRKLQRARICSWTPPI
jgi:hypothetical protein